ncbi:hypothetical protein JL12_08950 [Gallibacterium anatis 10672-6]|uniref:DUF2681 domain-containing protein n=1 Tax=Gallibacterium anatis TaxID=750 RepID=UPI0005316A0F|nr:DUF2681 domain-containing protein [Gallibacterium anatis]KGQ48580.1 hypothetical protein JL12_08950 [Gallibacterium anatis 10672-6]
MMAYLILGDVAVLWVGTAIVCYKIRKARQEIDRLFKQNEKLQNEKAVAETQVKHFEVRKKNEENTRGSRRDDVINRLQQSGDLRD